MMTLCGSFAFSGLLARAELVSPSKEGAQTLVSIYKNGLQSGMDLVWGTATTDLGYVNSSDTQNEGKTLAVDCTHAANTEFYIDFGKDYDIYTGAGFSSETLENFYKKSAVEFWIKLNDTPASFFNIYLFQSRGEEYASAPANQRYIRSNVQLKSYVDATIIGEWQYVQVPFTAFSSNGEYVNENNVKVKDTPVNLAKVCAIGFAHMMTDADTKITPTIQYDDLKFVYGNMNDENLGITVIPAKDYEKRKEQAVFTTIDIRNLATTGYYGGSGIGWTAQVAFSSLTSQAKYDAATEEEQKKLIVMQLRRRKTAMRDTKA